MHMLVTIGGMKTDGECKRYDLYRLPCYGNNGRR
ncbi:hypothetical protein [Sporomusa carbonis]